VDSLFNGASRPRLASHIVFTYCTACRIACRLVCRIACRLVCRIACRLSFRIYWLSEARSS